MPNRIESIRQSIDTIRKSGSLPHWRMVYAETLLTRAQEYIAVDRNPEAVRVLDKLDRWISQHIPPVCSESQANTVPMVFWNEPLLRSISENIRRTLQEKKLLVPSTERESILRRLDMVEEWIRKGNFLPAHDELLALRTSLIARLRRSYRARMATLSYQKDFGQPKGTLVGLYNSRHTLEETFHIVGERDPIWVEDFLEIYNDLFRIVERLVPQDKK